MSSTISNYGWNPLLSPSYSSWASMANTAGNLQTSGLSGQALTNVYAAQMESALFSPSGTPSLAQDAFSTLSLNPSEFSSIYNANQAVSSALGTGSMSTQNFLAQMQQYKNPLFQTGTSDGTGTSDMPSILSAWQNSLLDSFSPNYYLSTFNPYSVLGPSPSGSTVNTTG